MLFKHVVCYVITDAFNDDFIFLIQRSTSLRLVCISDVSYLQFTIHTFNSYLNNLGLVLQGGHSVCLS